MRPNYTSLKPWCRGGQLTSGGPDRLKDMRHISFAIGIGLLLAPGAAAQAPMTSLDSARHVLNRLSYGALPGEVEAVAREGVLKWINQQLGFTEIGDPALKEIESGLDILHTTPVQLQAMQQRQQAQVQRAQAIVDSTARMQALDLLRQNQQDGRQDLRFLFGELASVTVVRAVQSDRQLPEILADFWTNHFNVFIGKNQDRPFFPEYLEATLRAHALGRFDELLIATAKSPAMLLYLDNAQSVAANSDLRLLAMEQMQADRNRPGVVLIPRSRRPAFNLPQRRAVDSAQMARLRQNAPRGLNENYARELMELPTLGVDGGYTQQDVINVARILTGWGVDRRDGSFAFRAAAHDQGAKVVLGEKFPANHGEDEGMRLLRLLASSPATMHHVSAQLCARFVADAAPDGCIDDAVRAWKRSKGDIREVVRAIVLSPDFWAPRNVQSKVKTPLEFVVSAVRALGGTPDPTPRTAQRIAQLGEPLFQKQTPNGYGESEEDWVNSGALLARMNFAVQLASGRLPGVVIDLEGVVPLTPDHAVLVDQVNRSILSGAMTSHTREVILKQLAEVADPGAARALAVGLALGGPEFQRQ